MTFNFILCKKFFMKNNIEFSRPVTELIKIRHSWRNFSSDPIEDEKIRLLNDFISSLPAPPFGSDTSFCLIQDRLDGKNTVPGTYGVIKGAENFIAGTVKKGRMNLEDFGYLFEHIILFSTDMELATCWMGGTFSHTSFAKKIGLGSDEILPAISPLGYAKKKRAFMDKMISLSAGSAKRNPWQDMFFDQTFSAPITQMDAGSYNTTLEMVRLAPSSTNRQPWRLIRDGDTFHLFLQRTPVFDKIYRADLQRIDMGICMCHFDLTAKEAGLPGRWEVKPVDIGPLPKRTEYVASWRRG